MSQPPAKDNKQSQAAKGKNAKKDTKKPEPKKEEIKETKVVEPPKVLTADELQALLVAGNSKNFSPSAIRTKKFVISD